MTSTQVVEMSVTNNTSFQNYPHLDNHTIRKTNTISMKTDKSLKHNGVKNAFENMSNYK